MQVSDGNQVWIRVADHLRTQVTEAVWMSTFSDVRPIKVDDRQLTVSVPSNQARERIMNRWLLIVNEALDERRRQRLPARRAGRSQPGTHRAGPGHRMVRLARRRRGRRLDGHDTVPVRGGFGASSVLDEAGLNPRYTFETFVKGASNQFALAAALRVAETPGRSYNPLFIYGSAGLGKTHLLHAIGHYVHHNYQHHDRALRLHRDVPQRVRRRHPHQHHRRLQAPLPRHRRPADRRHPVHGEQEGLQEEFFHTFNSLHGANKQIVISSDRMPDAIPTLEERLRGRFKWGLITDIQPPDLETRLAILRNKAERDQSPGARRDARVHRHPDHHQHP